MENTRQRLETIGWIAFGLFVGWIVVGFGLLGLPFWLVDLLGRLLVS
jgi:hypothetical protein